MTSETANRAAPPPGANAVHDVFLTFIDPARVFFNLPRVNRSTTVLVILLTVLGLLGWMTASTGVYDYEVRRVAARAAYAYEKKHEGDDDPNVAREAAEAIEKGAEFQVIVNRVVKTFGRPLQTLAGVGLLAGFLFVAVALSGGKPKMSLLTGIVVFASLVQIPQDAVKLYLTARTNHSRVETSAAAFPKALGGEEGVSLAAYIGLRRLNPFDVWFWWLMVLGARKAARMSIRGTTIVTILMILFNVVWLSAFDYVELAEMPVPAEGAQ